MCVYTSRVGHTYNTHTSIHTAFLSSCMLLSSPSPLPHNFYRSPHRTLRAHIHNPVLLCRAAHLHQFISPILHNFLYKKSHVEMTTRRQEETTALSSHESLMINYHNQPTPLFPYLSSPCLPCLCYRSGRWTHDPFPPPLAPPSPPVATYLP